MMISLVRRSSLDKLQRGRLIWLKKSGTKRASGPRVSIQRCRGTGFAGPPASPPFQGGDAEGGAGGVASPAAQGGSISEHAPTGLAPQPARRHHLLQQRRRT